jgi:hypothetical protein
MSEHWDFEFDVVCAGSGIGGCAAAITAAASGLRTVLLEKAELVGGVTAYSGGQVWIPANRHARSAGINDSVEEGVKYIERLGEGWANSELTRSLLGSANDALDFYEARGLRVHMIPGLCDYYYPDMPHSKADGRYLEPDPFDLVTLGGWQNRLRISPHSPTSKAMLSPESVTTREGVVTGGEALAGYFICGALSLGVELWNNSPIVELISHGGRVEGVRVKTPQGERRIRAFRGVMLATGAYDWNEELTRRFEGALDESSSLVPPGIDGDHFALASDLGAAIVTLPPQRCAIAAGYMTGAHDEAGHAMPLSYWSVGPHEIFVNRAGERFADETFYPSVHGGFQTFDTNTHLYPNWPAWLVFDANYLSSAAREVQPAALEKYRVHGDSLVQLAERVGINPQGLEKSVQRYNAMCAQGRDQDFGRGERLWVKALTSYLPCGAMSALGPIERPPFYAVRLMRIQIGISSAGLQINEYGQVTRFAGRAIEGLYAAGNAAGRNDIGICLQSGVANLRGMVYGYRAALHMSG